MPARNVSLTLAAFAIVLAACGGTANAPGGSAPAKESAAQAAPAARMAPDFELKDINGKTVHLSDSTGTVRLVDFWTTWCSPCREEIPMFKDLHATYGAKGLTLVGIAMDDGGASVVKPFVDENQIPYLTLIGSDPVATAFGGVVGFPTKFLVDRQGHIVESWIGPVPRAVLEKRIQTLL